MRLLAIQPDGTLALTEDLNEDIPRYAILSHTWGPDNQEVTFKDIEEGAGQHKEGYRKIEFCRDRAASDGFQHFWVDTCCIDKSNNTELSEAINSMFRWYKHAAKCYAYLSDVSKSHAEHVNEPLRSIWKREFRKSRWLTRSWTLQELIAPHSVEFFDRDGQRLGDKESLIQLLHDTTRISIDALLGRRPPSSFSIDERMLWSSGRDAKKPEDTAYSLMGIFNVFMPPLYGEGKDEAMRRLRGKIDIRLGKPVLDKLPLAAGAAFDSHAEEHNPTCLPDTRVNLLRDIRLWVDDPEAKAVFWLNGMAGTGKSTISRTIARSSFGRARLGASFFFKRGEGDRGGASKFFTTIAFQLIRCEPALAVHIKDVIDADPAIFNKALREQFEKLIYEPLSKLHSHDRNTVVRLIVVDALDECDDEEDIGRIISLLSRANGLGSSRLKVFLTSRPELPIRLGFFDVNGTYQALILHEVAQSTIEHDLYIYFKDELTRIREKYNKSVIQQHRLPSPWPEQSQLERLVNMAFPLFIFAATACRFIADRKIGTPDIKLHRILERQTKSQESKFDATYLPVLEQLLVDQSDSEKDEILSRFKHLVGSIVLLATPLSIHALAHLLNIAENSVANQLGFLHSVLSVPSQENYPVRLLHLSFRDFLVDPSKNGKNPFWVDEGKGHSQLLADCLRIMSESLHTDICEVKWPGTACASINPQIITQKLPPAVQYACQHWVHHLQQARSRLCDDDHVHRFLKRHFLHWLEALSLINRATESLQHLKTLQSLAQPKRCSQLSDFVNDALRFVRTNVSTIQATPLQTYCSSLAFAPEHSVVRDTFQGDIPDWILLRPKVNAHWSNLQQTLEGHTACVSSVAFSPNGSTVASASDDRTVRLWSAHTGELQQTLKDDGGSLLTNVGAIFLSDPLHPIPTTAVHMGEPSLRSSCRQGYGISKDQSWVTLHGKNMFWLAVDCRPGVSSVSGSTIVIGTGLGRVIILRFPIEALVER